MLMRSRARRTASALRDGSHRVARPGRWPWVLLGVALVAQVVACLMMTRGAWMTADPVYYITERGAVPGADEGLLPSHRGHWLTVPLLMYRALFPLIGMAHGWPYLLISIALHVGIVLVLFSVLRRAGWGLRTAVLTVLPVVFLGAGSQVFVADHPMPLILSLFFGLLALRAAQGPDTTSVRVRAAVLLLLGVMSSGVGLVGLVLVAALLFLRHGLRSALVTTAPVLAIFVVWFLTAGQNFTRADLSPKDALLVPHTVWVGATSALEAASGVPGSGALLLAVLVLVPIVAPRIPRELRHLAWVGQVGAGTQLTLSAIGGLPDNYPPITESRYAYIVLVLLAPSLAVVLLVLRRALAPVRQRAALVVLAAVVAVAYLANAYAIQREQANVYKTFTSSLRDRVVGAVAAEKAGEQVLTARPDGLDERMNIRLVTSPSIVSSLPQGTVSTRQRVEAESEFFVGVSRYTFGLFAPRLMVSYSFDQGLVPGTNCADYRSVSDAPRIAIDTGDGVEIGVRSESTRVSTHIERDPVISGSRTWKLTPGVPIHIATTAKDARLVITFNRGGLYTICKH